MTDARRQLPGGLLVVVEGIDGAGKTTLVTAMERELAAAGWEVVRTREPTTGPWGQRLRDLAARGERIDPAEEALWFLEDRRQDVAETIAPALARGAVVLVDRYYYSNMAYQGARGLDPRQIKADNETFAPPPDLLLIVDLPPERAIRERIEGKRGESPNAFETLDNLRVVRDIYLAIAESEPMAVTLDGALAADEVARGAIARVDAAIRRKQGV